MIKLVFQSIPRLWIEFHVRTYVGPADPDALTGESKVIKSKSLLISIWGERGVEGPQKFRGD